MKMLVTYFALCVVLFSRATSDFAVPLPLDALLKSKVVRVHVIHEIHCEAYDHLSGIRAEVVYKGCPFPVPVPSQLKGYMDTHCQMINQNAEHAQLNEELLLHVRNERTGSLVSATRFVVSNDVTSAQQSQTTTQRKSSEGESKVKIQGDHVTQPSVIIRGGATTLRHSSLLPLLLLLMTFAL